MRHRVGVRTACYDRTMRPLPLALLAACSEYNVAGKKEVAPGFDTGDSFRPPIDTHEEETGTPVVDTGSCEEQTGPLPYEVGSDEACVREPTVGSFDPVVEWQWTTNPVNSGYDDIMSTPAVGNLTDDDGDGDVDGDDTPDIVFTAFSGGAYTSAGALTAISGDGSGTLWSITSPPVYSSAGVAIGDLDGDGWPEVCTAGTGKAVVCVNGVDGSVLWAAGTEVSYVGAPAIADMDGDGCAEVILGRQIFDCAGTQVGLGAYGQGGSQQFSFAVDMDNDGALEVVAGNAVYERDGSLVWTNGLSDGMPAVGNFDGDLDPEIVVVAGGQVWLLDNDGTQIWRTSLPSGSGGPPTVADFDGDGEPEVGVAGASDYSVYDTDGTRMWSMPVSDYSSNVTGSSVFDFEGDGAAEVVYADEHTLWVYDGATGAVEMQETGHASGTLYEYPLIADVDNDDSTEIIVASNNYAYSGWNGITVLGDASSDWAPARPIWNQFAYHITNVENDGGIPAVQDQNWLSWNNFRAGGTELGPSHWLPDLALGEPSVCLADCDSNATVDVWIPVENGGLLEVTEAELAFLRGDGTVSRTETVGPIPAGEAIVAGPYTFAYADWAPGVMTAVIDPDDTIEECDETDNTREVGGWECP
jgi:hypothetical protein